MPMLGSEALKKISSGQLSLGSVLSPERRGEPILAKEAGFDWLSSIPTANHTHEFLRSPSRYRTGVAPMACLGALERHTRARQRRPRHRGPHVDTPEQAKRLVDAFRYPPMGHRSAGGPPAQFGYRPPQQVQAQVELNAEILIVPMIETPQAVENADAIAAVKGIDCLLIGTNDLSNEMGITAQPGHERCRRRTRPSIRPARSQKICVMGGVAISRGRPIPAWARSSCSRHDHAC